ncbi:hypothetical protein K493DRAFT_352913 [Basidiobolus meristosporus CBS 931.73]|uniref:BZIP domain-containing protein n=1 Tax=Basidiobolus meristosporus CBS 931.73 TaxID=1314790 RepID=A0A1Y1Y7I4_9FUNG|nr:hypothetical protein K493DRAFT_352913 [Basidiobolus meristosporus CBS 931.73]|eukprot:ORX93963.1 hypothetical protein K493DRAFT_352913 [Basidiobolus meristosporus CBS 931.73]
MDLDTNLLNTVSSHMITKPLPTPIRTLMEQFADGKSNPPNEVNEFDQVFSTDYLSNSDNDAEQARNPAYDASKLSDRQNSVSEDEFLMNYNFGTNLATQPSFAHDMIAQSAIPPSYEFDHRATPSKFDWGNLSTGVAAGSIAGAPMGAMSLMPSSSDGSSQRRSSLPGNGVAAEFSAMADFNHNRKRVFSWADMNHSNLFGPDMDFAQSVRRSSVNIPLQNIRNQVYLDPYGAKDPGNPDGISQTHSASVRNTFPLDDALTHSPSFSLDDTLKHDSKAKKLRENNDPATHKKPLSSHGRGDHETTEPDGQVSVIERRLNRRRERNRLAARRSREKRTQFLRDLEGLNDSLRNENNALKAKLCEVLRELEVLRATTVGIAPDANPNRRQGTIDGALAPRMSGSESTLRLLTVMVERPSAPAGSIALDGNGDFGAHEIPTTGDSHDEHRVLQPVPP